MDPSKILHASITCCTSTCQMADLAKQICWEWQEKAGTWWSLRLVGFRSLLSLYLLLHMWGLIIYISWRARHQPGDQVTCFASLLLLWNDLL